MSARLQMADRMASWATAVVLLFPATRAAAGMTVSSELSATGLRVADTLVLRVVARWEGGEELYRFSTPRPGDNPYLQLAGQSVGGQARLEDSAFVSEKSWHFSFVCVLPGSTEVVPPVIVYTNTETEVTDSVVGSPMFLAIGAAPEPPFDYRRGWPYLLALIIAGVVVFAALRLTQIRRRATKSKKLHQTPEEEAAQLLEALQALKREDRGEQFYTDLEKIILGLWEARAGRRLAGKTPREVADILDESGVDDEVIGPVRATLTECQNARFGGGRVDIETMENSLETVQAWVKPPDGS